MDISISNDQDNQKDDNPIPISNSNNNNPNSFSSILEPPPNQLPFTNSSIPSNQDIPNPSLFPQFENPHVPKEQLLSRKCKNHSYSTCNLIHLNAATKHVCICFMCAQQQLIPHEELLLISELLNSNANSFLSTYPVLSDKQTAKNVQGLFSCLEQKMEQIEEFFNDLKEAVLASINKVQRAQKLHVNRLSELYQRTMDSFQETSKIEEFQQILRSREQNSEEILKAFIIKHCTKAEENTAKIKEKYQEFSNFMQRFSLARPTEIKDAVIGMLQQIEMFSGAAGDANRLNNELNQKILQSSIKKAKNKNQQQGNVQLAAQENIPKRQRKPQQNQNQQPQQQQQQPQQQPQQPQPQQPQPQQQQQQQQQQANFNNNIPHNQAQRPQSLLTQVSFIPSQGYKISYHYTQIERLRNYENHIKITNNDPTNNNQNNIQCYMQQRLMPNHKYIIQLKLQNISDFPPLIRFGLIEDAKKYKDFIGDSHLSYTQTDGGYITKIIKGQQLHSGNLVKKIGEKTLEVRIHLQERLFRIGNHPEYENVAEINNPMDIRSDKQYFFGININNFKDSVSVINVVQVDHFDNKM